MRGRCRSTNQCDYCARLGAVENAEALALDAFQSSPPRVWAVLSTRSTDPRPESFYRSRAKVMKAVKLRWPDAEYAALVEFTTGYGPRAGGRRRPHWNLLLKGIPASDVHELRDVIVKVWCSREDARPAAQFVGPVAEVGGLMRYLALHFQKSSQSPPHGWRGHRFTHSRGYFAAGIVETRKRAREALQYRREVHKIERAAQDQGADLMPDEVHELAAKLIERAASIEWDLFQVLELAPRKPKPPRLRMAS